MPSKQCTVVVADQHPVVRAGVRSLLQQAKIAVVGEASNGLEAVALVKKHKPSVAILNHPMPEMSGLLAALDILSGDSGTRVLIFSSDSTEATLERAYRYRVAGYILKSGPGFADLVKAVQKITDGGEWYDAPIREHYARFAHTAGYARMEPSPLSVGQIRVLQMIAEGKQAKEIGAVLGISPNTVCRHRDEIMCRLKIHDAVGLTRYAIRNQFVDLEAATT